MAEIKELKIRQESECRTDTHRFIWGECVDVLLWEVTTYRWVKELPEAGEWSAVAGRFTGDELAQLRDWLTSILDDEFWQAPPEGKELLMQDLGSMVIKANREPGSVPDRGYRLLDRLAAEGFKIVEAS